MCLQKVEKVMTKYELFKKKVKKMNNDTLKKALIIYSVPTEFCTFAVIYWTSKKGNESKKTVELPYKSRKERKGKL